MIVTSIYDLWLKVMIGFWLRVMIEKQAESPPLALDDLSIVSGSIWMVPDAAVAARSSGHTIPRLPSA
jgi:hypothetical protein